MVVRGTARVTCPACGEQHDGKLVQTINTQTNPQDKQRLLDGELNVLACPSGKRTQLSANLLFHDPDATVRAAAARRFGQSGDRTGEVSRWLCDAATDAT